MQIIVVLMGLFFVASAFRGPAKGAKIVGRFVAWLFRPIFWRRPSSTDRDPAPALPVLNHSAGQGYLNDLQELHSLYQRGGLSEDEFKQFKQRLLSTIVPTIIRSDQETT